MALSLEQKTDKYVDTPLTEFPVKEDSFDRMSDVTSDLMQLVISYNQYFQSGNIAACNKLLKNNPNLLNCFFTADKYNQLRDALIAMERFTLEEIETMINDVAQHAIGINDNPNKEEKHLVAYSAKGAETVIGNMISNYHMVIPVTFSANKWEEKSSLFTQTVYVEIVTEQDRPTLVKYIPEDHLPDSLKTYNKIFGYFADGYGETGDQTVTWTCLKKPPIDMTIGLQGIGALFGKEIFSRGDMQNIVFGNNDPDQGTHEIYGLIDTQDNNEEVHLMNEVRTNNYVQLEPEVLSGDVSIIHEDSQEEPDTLYVAQIINKDTN